jgi:hypothetical protein
MVMPTMLFIAEQRAAHSPASTCCHRATSLPCLPRKPEGKVALVRRINVISGGWAPSNPVSAPQQNPSRYSQ